MTPGDAALWAVTALQAAYLLVSVLVVAVPATRRGRSLPAREPAVYRRVHVLLPVAGADRATVAAALERLAAASYPVELLTVHPLAPPEETAPSVREFLSSRAETEGGLEVDVVDAVGSHSRVWTLGDAFGSAAFDAALTALDLPAAAVVTVLDPRDRYDAELFERGVAGLESVDVAQAKRTVATPDGGGDTGGGAGRAGDDGAERSAGRTGAGLAGWSHAIYPGTRGPARLLATGYFLTAGRLLELRTQAPTTPVDLALARRGASVGVVDAVVAEAPPPASSSPLATLRARTTRFRRHVEAEPLDRFDRLRLLLGDVAPASAVADSPLGVPLGVGAVAAAWLLTGGVPVALAAVAAANVAVWLTHRRRRREGVRAAGDHGVGDRGVLAAVRDGVWWTRAALGGDPEPEPR